jgi:Asp/Glu/hydantoin racemase
MKKVSLVNVTLNAANPMTKYLLTKDPEIHVMNYLDSSLMDNVRRDGKITDESMGRILAMLTKACVDGSDGIILTCTVFSPYVNIFRKIFSIPIVSPDTAMLEKAAKKGGKTAILCTFPATVDSSLQLYNGFLEQSGVEAQVVTYLLEDAYIAAQKQNMDEHNRIIQKKVKEIEANYDTVVLAQISMAGAANGLENCKAEVLTSPASAYYSLVEQMKLGEKK